MHELAVLDWLSPAWLLGLAALITALGGIASTLMSHRASKIECRERLRQVQYEADNYAAELHTLRKQSGELG